MLRLLRQFERSHPFTNNEAWFLFRLAAFGEAIGWTLLIAGIAIEKYLTPGVHFAVPIAGRLHGTLFFGYLAACMVLYSSLGWSRGKALVALALSVPPYGSLAFERYAAYRRRSHGFRTYRQYLQYTALVSLRP